jgi:hypothetical protein
MGFTYKEAIKLTKERAGFGYSKSAYILLTRMVGSTNRGVKKIADIGTLTMEASIATVMKWAGVTSVRQIGRILTELVLRFGDRSKGKLRYGLNMEALYQFEPAVDTVKQSIKDRNKARTEKATAQRAALRKRKVTRKAFAIIGHCFGFVLNGGYSAETQRKHGSLFRAEVVRRGPIKVATQ